MPRFDRLTCEIVIWADVVLNRGLDAFNSQRSSDLPLRSPSELSAQWGIPLWAMQRTTGSLRNETVVSPFARDPGRYVILKPKRFLRGLTDRLTTKLGKPVALTLPPVLRDKTKPELLAAISNSITKTVNDSNQQAYAILHSAFLDEAPDIANAQIYSGAGPLTLALTATDLRNAESALNLVRLKLQARQRSTANPLGLPDGFAYSDLLVFVRRLNVSLWGTFNNSSVPRISTERIPPVNPIVNALLLSLYNLRGEEAAAQLLEVLKKKTKVDKKL